MVRRRSLTAAIVAAALAAATLVDAGPSEAQEEPSAGAAANDQALVAIDVDMLLRRERGDRRDAGRHPGHVEAEKAALTEAQTNLSNAQTALATAEAAVADTQARLTAINRGRRSSWSTPSSTRRTDARSSR